ncbi:MAG: carboxypeptidase-like regulatory domain-containing protein [Longimicrobiales bacterium]|nr:carboxypeptidase-like regulatory domain-containing protein [Longimicrobiales bacterium]
MAHSSLLGLTIAIVLWPGVLPGPPGFTVEGRVVEGNATAGIRGATLELEGPSLHTTLSGADGRFRFEGVEPGGYAVRVLRRGYRPRSQYVFVDEDMALILPLDAAPALEERAGAGRPGGGGVALRGVVREGRWGLPLPDVEVLTDLGTGTRTGARGGFLLGGSSRGRPVWVSVRAFGYMPLDTILRAGGGTFHDLKLNPDLEVQRRIRREVDVLGRSSGAHRGSHGGLGREALLASDAPTLAGVLRTHYGDVSNRISCVLLDEGAVEKSTQLLKLVPGRIQQVDLLPHPGEPENLVARVYTRRFVRDLVAGGVEAAPGEIAYVHEAGRGADTPAESPICPTEREGQP